jgi:hypothetical protein
MRVVLIHGIHSVEGNNNMSALHPYIRRDLPGVDVELYQYGFMGFWQARWRNKVEAEKFADYLAGDDSVVITHSNGAAITYLACREFQARPAVIININPALDRWRTSPVDWVLTIHSRNDRAVNLSQWLPGHIWGDQGRVGYRGTRTNTSNLDASSQPGRMAYDGHCGLFKPERISDWSHLVTDYIAERALV